MLSDNTGFTLSIGKLTAIIISVVGMSFTIGMSYQSLMPDRELQKKQTEKIEKIEITMERVTTVLEKLEEKTSQHSQAINDVQTKINTVNTEVQVIGSYVKQNEERKGRR